MSDEQKLTEILRTVIAISATQEQMVERLDSIDKRLSNMEIKMGKVEKWVALENSDLFPGKEKDQ